jgi:hypothetical protein
MSLAPAENRISREKYLEGELVSEIRHEYVAGNVYVMSGGTLNHQRRESREISRGWRAQPACRKTLFPHWQQFQTQRAARGRR